jgi:antitoxin component HigA of HigAB toxin-antitoxin module
MEIRPIRTETDYQVALQEIASLFDAVPNTPEYDRLDVLSTLVDAYEKEHFPIELPDPIAFSCNSYTNSCKPIVLSCRQRSRSKSRLDRVNA